MMKTRHVTIIYNKDGKECVYDCQIKEFSYSEPQRNPEFTMIVGKDAQGKAIYGDENPLVLTEKGDVEHQIHWEPRIFNRTYMYSGYRQQKDYVTEWIVPRGNILCWVTTEIRVQMVVFGVSFRKKILWVKLNLFG